VVSGQINPEANVLASNSGRALADRLAAHESLRKEQCRFRLTDSRWVLDD
jgi:hypothetical protein